jgi:hypothetical protein
MTRKTTEAAPTAAKLSRRRFFAYAGGAAVAILDADNRTATASNFQGNTVAMDADEIAARFFLTNIALSDFKAGTITLNDLAKAHFAPGADDIAGAKLAIVNRFTRVPAITTCNPCRINGKSYYGLTRSQCLAMGGTCLDLFDKRHKPGEKKHDGEEH